MLHATEPLLVAAAERAVAIDVLTTLAHVRFAVPESLLAVFGPAGLRAEHLTDWDNAGLVGHGLAAVDPIARTSRAFVALTGDGARALHAATGRPVPFVSPARLRRSSPKLAHDLGVGEVALSFIASARSGMTVLAAVECDDKKLGCSAAIATPAAKRVPLQPDAFVLLDGARGRTGFLVEYDRATTAAKRLETKFRGYFAWLGNRGPARDFGLAALRVLVVVPDERRRDKLHAAALTANGGKRSGFIVFALDGDVRPSDPERLAVPIGMSVGGANVPLVV